MGQIRIRVNKPRPVGHYLVLIPTKGRPKSLRKLFTKQPFLNACTTYVGIENREWNDYRQVFRDVASHVRTVNYDNPTGITSVAREMLRRVAIDDPDAHTLLPLDDNMFYTEESLWNLVCASREMNRESTKPIIVSGEHPTAEHFQADRIPLTKTLPSGLRVFPHTTVIYWAIPRSIYEHYRYPVDCCFDDIHLALWSMTKGGATEFFVCRDAPFNKRRFESGGQGNAAERAQKFGMGITRLATDFPQWMTTSIVQTRIPYSKILEALRSGRTGF